MEDGYQSFVTISAKDGSEDLMELPREKDGTVLLSTVQAQFPSAIGIKYKSSSGCWRGIRAENNVLYPPYGGWGDAIYTITESDTLKRKFADHGEHERKSRRLLHDMIVLGLPYTTTEEELNTFFTDTCGELVFCELKIDRTTKKSRGFAFIRFKDESTAQKALQGHHEIDGRKLEIRLSKKRGDVPMKLFVGRLATGTRQDEVDDYFSAFGDLTDVFVPLKPFRGFGFVTYCKQEDGMKVLHMSHFLRGSRLNVVAADPKEHTGPGKQENFGTYRRTNLNPSYGQNARHDRSQNVQQPQQQQSAIGQKDMVSELLVMLINSRK